MYFFMERSVPVIMPEVWAMPENPPKVAHAKRAGSIRPEVFMSGDVTQ